VQCDGEESRSNAKKKAEKFEGFIVSITALTNLDQKMVKVGRFVAL
jgi:hypothetical protein